MMNPKRNIAIIGAGNIGSRHLQAMRHLDFPAIIHVVDPSDISLGVAQKRFWEENRNRNNEIELKLLKNIEELEDSLDLAIVATCADIRAQVIRELVSKKDVQNLILEKVLFQKLEDYSQIDGILEEKRILAWVNCWPRTTDFYKELKTKLDLRENISLNVDGSSWGLGCNSVHFLDLFAFFMDCYQFEFIECCLDDEMIPAKRKGFFEFTGRLKGINSQKHSITLNCKKNGSDPIRLVVVNGMNRHEIIDYSDNSIYTYDNGTTVETKKVISE